MSGATLDWTVLEAVRHGTYAIAEEMRFDLMRSARSPVLREAGDLSCALTDAAGATVAQGNDIPMHLGVIGYTVRCLLERIDAASLRPDDVFFVNDPDVGGNHLPDVKAIRPVFAGERPWAFAVALAHWPDVGGALPGSYVPDARDIHQEGLVIPPTKLFDAAGDCREALAFVLANVRGAAERIGDIRAQAAATGVAARRLGELADRHGLDSVLRGWEAMREESATRLRRAVAALPDGVYEGVDALDDDGITDAPIEIRCRLTIVGERATFDYGESADQTAGPVNTTRFITAAATQYVALAVLAPEAAPNAGIGDALEVRTRRGSVCDAGAGAPLVAGNHETSQRIADAAMRALERVVPERVVAAGMGSSGLALFSGENREGRPFVLYETHAGGAGASASRDGDAATRIHMSNVMNTPAEVIEAEYPLRVERAAVRAGAGGAGTHTGGEGLVRAYRVLEDGVRLTTMVERCRIAPPGGAGGEPGALSEVWLDRDGDRRRLPGKTSLELRAGDRVEVLTAGGGGWGRDR
ncbi:MAG: hydantoinase B/oxoprolinase family protein [Actinobacteria bacterium]|nr:hydantoinase B/oxoprolinase family protein [Actinomycetota bacterium]